MDVGRLCVKLAGRDAGMTCVVVDVLDKNNVMIDGQTRRRKCNINHLEALDKSVKLSKGASHADVKKVFKDLKLEIRETKPKKTPARVKKTKAKKTYAKKETKKEVKKQETKEVTTEKNTEKQPVKKTTKSKTTKK